MRRNTRTGKTGSRRRKTGKRKRTRRPRKKFTQDDLKRKIKIIPLFLLCFWKLIMFQILKKQKEAHKVWWVVIGGVSAGSYSWSPGTDLGFDSHCRLLRCVERVQRQGLQIKRCVPRNSQNIWRLTSQQELEEDPERACNEGWRKGHLCMWPNKNRQKACLP